MDVREVPALIQIGRYNDDKFEYRHVQLPKNMLKKIPSEYFDSAKGTLKLLWEDEWRALGITQVWRIVIGLYVYRSSHTRAEFRMGALRGARAGASHSSLQVSPLPPWVRRPD